eukprot:m.28780 g.28780  ORF g.28780 m.28780 type:complete len:766 (+) comp10476_c0_seq2:346-2643(+)
MSAENNVDDGMQISTIDIDDVVPASRAASIVSPPSSSSPVVPYASSSPSTTSASPPAREAKAINGTSATQRTESPTIVVHPRGEEPDESASRPSKFQLFSDVQIDRHDPDLAFSHAMAQIETGVTEEVEREPEEADEREKRQSILSMHGRAVKAYMQFSDLRYEVDIKVEKKATTKEILKGLSGDCKPGHVLAIMGASGAGKTTLLNILAGRLSQSGNGRTSGHILVNGHKRDYTTFRKQSAYVLQHDVFYAEMTVRETIMLSALLRLPREMSTEDKMRRVDGIITELGLAKCQNTVLGNDLIRGVSGGERKRCNIGTELVVDPSLIFLDEPTTGLDAFNAQNVMTSLLTLAKAGRTIVCTIHQPRSEIYATLDELMLLSEGYTMYFGPAKEAADYFSNLGYPCPESYNPSDFFLDLVSYDARSKDKERITKKRIQYLAERYDDYRSKHPLALLDSSELMSSQSMKALHDDPDMRRKYAISWLAQFKLLLQRAGRILTRERATNVARIMQALFFSIILGIIWFDEGGDDSGSSIQAIAGALFFILINQSFGGVFQIIFVFPSERAIVLKERASRSYHVGAYFWAKMLAELPRTLLINLAFAVITYTMIHLRPGIDNFFQFFVVLFGVTLAAESIAYCVSAIARDPQQAGAIAPIFIITSILFGGFFIGVNAIPAWLSWLRYLSYLKYGFAAAMQVEFENRPLNTGACAPNTQFCPSNGNDVLAFYDLDELTYGVNVLILYSLAVAFRILSYWILRRNGPVYDTTI